MSSVPSGLSSMLPGSGTTAPHRPTMRSESSFSHWEDMSMAPQFSKPSDYKGNEYDEKGGSVWRVRVPLGSVRRIVLTDGAGLAVRSNNPQVILNSKLDEETV